MLNDESVPAPSVFAARQISANALTRAAADIGSKLATFALFVAMARKLGATHFGVFTFALSLASLLSVLVDFGQALVLTREVARDRSLVHRYFGNTLALQAALALPVLGIAAVAALATQSGETRVVVLLLALAVVVDVLTGTCFAVFVAYERFVFNTIALVAQRFATTAAAVGALFAGAGVEAVAGIYLAGSVFGFCLAVALLYRRVVRPRIEVTPGLWGSIVRAAIPIGLAGLFGTVLFRVDTAMLAAYEPKHVVGNYGAAYRILEATLFLGWSAGGALFPVYARPRESSDLRRVFAGSSLVLLAVALPGALVAAFLARPVLDLLYGSDYRDATTALRLLAPAIALYPVSYAATVLLIARHRQRLVVIVTALVAAENILANLYLIPRWSLDGAAAGTSISQLLVALPLIVLASREVGRSTP